MEQFKLLGGSIIEDVGQYSRDYIKNNVNEHSEMIIYVGTDSKQHRKFTMYATVIAFYHIGKGAHIIFNRTRVPKIKDIFTRLYNEVEMTRCTAEELDNELLGNYHFKWTRDNIWTEIGGIKVENIKISDNKNGTCELDNIVKEYNNELLHKKSIVCDLDLNPNKKYKSYMVHDIGVGALKGSGFRVRTKPKSWCASVAADMICK